MATTEQHEASGLRWWDQQLQALGGGGGVGADVAQQQVPFRAVFFPALLRACEPQTLPAELSRDELRVVAQCCLSATAWERGVVTRENFRRFLARFGPLEQSLAKVLACFCVNREIVPWFHGEMGRAEAERLLSDRSLDDGAFLLRFSESQPTKFTLSYLKVHAPGLSRTPGKRELKNCLVSNLGAAGYALVESVRSGHSTRQRTYPSIGAFVQCSAARLKFGVVSSLSTACNQELAAVRALQDQQTDAYTAFSSESLATPTLSPSLLFSRSPTMQPQSIYGSAQMADATADCNNAADTYAGFSLDSLASPVVHRVATPRKTQASVDAADNNQLSHDERSANEKPLPASLAMGDYGDFASCSQPQQPDGGNGFDTPALMDTKCEPKPMLETHPPLPDEYSTFAALASNFAEESQQLAARGQLAVSLSKSPSFKTCMSSHFPPTFPPAAPVSVQTTSAQPYLVNNSAYKSFASMAVSIPAAIEGQRGGSLPVPRASDYGSFASFFDPGKTQQSEQIASLGPPPPPPASLARASPSYDKTAADEGTGTYGSFASLSIRDDAVAQPIEAQEKTLSSSCLPPEREVSSTKSSDVYGSFDPALAAVASSKTASAPESSSTASALDELNTGMDFYKQKRLDDALLRFMLAQEVARATEDKVVEARALGNLGTVYLDKQSPQQAVRCYQQCLDITRSIEDTKRERTILNNLVLALVASEEFERALACCQVQLETTTNAINRHKIVSRMSLLRERMNRRDASSNAGADATPSATSV